MSGVGPCSPADPCPYRQEARACTPCYRGLLAEERCDPDLGVHAFASARAGSVCACGERKRPAELRISPETFFAIPRPKGRLQQRSRESRRGPYAR